MVLIKHNYLKLDIFFNPIFIPGFSGSRFFRVRVQGPDPGFWSSRFVKCFNLFRLIVSTEAVARRCSAEKVLLEIFAKFTGIQLCQSSFFNKVAGLRPATLLKKRPWRLYFPVNFTKFLRTPFLQNTFGWLLLSVLTFKTKMCPLLSARLLSFIKPM